MRSGGDVEGEFGARRSASVERFVTGQRHQPLGAPGRPDQSEEAPEPVDDEEVFEEDESLELLSEEDELDDDDDDEPFEESLDDDPDPASDDELELDDDPELELEALSDPRRESFL